MRWEVEFVMGLLGAGGLRPHRRRPRQTQARREAPGRTAPPAGGARAHRAWRYEQLFRPERPLACSFHLEPEESDHARDRPGEGRQGARRRPSGRAHADRARVRQGLGHAHGRRGRPGALRRDPHGRALARPRARDRRRAAGTHRRALRPGVLGQDDAHLPRARGGAEARRRVRVHRRRARDGPALREGDRRRHRRAARLPARLRRAGPGDRRHARALRAPWTWSRSTRSPR